MAQENCLPRVGYLGRTENDRGREVSFSDIDAARAELVERGLEVSDFFHFGEAGQMPGHDPQRQSYNSFVSFDDPDGNTWLVQEVKR